jgi:Putative zincin peptidase
MFFIPGFLISLLTFPGVIVHEIAHRMFADLAKVPVYDVCYFRLGNPAGYVIHGPASDLRKSLLISIGPLIVNTLLCAVICFSAIFPIFILDAKIYSPVFGLLMWTGISIGMHAFPSNQDMNNFVESVAETHQKGPILWAAKLFSGLLRLANLLRFFWFDAIYAFAAAAFLPWALGYI